MDEKEGADFIKQLQSMPYRNESGDQLTKEDFIKYMHNDHQSLQSHNSFSSATTQDIPHSLSNDSSLGTCATSGGLGPAAGGESSACSSLTSTSNQSHLKSPTVSSANQKYLGVEMGHVDFSEEPTETNEESLMKIVDSMDYLLEENSSKALKKSAEQRIKTAYNLTYNS